MSLVQWTQQVQMEKDFEENFRTPLPVFMDIVRLCKETNDDKFNYPEYHPIDNSKNIPLELKVLFVLRILAGGIKFGDAAELCGFISASYGNTVFKDFCRLFRAYFQDTYIRPLEGDELSRAMEMYARLGLPGCIGSIDATFVPWELCSQHLKNVSTGDKGQGLLFHCVVTHTKECLSVDKSLFCSINDQTGVKYSGFIDISHYDSYVHYILVCLFW